MIPGCALYTVANVYSGDLKQANPTVRDYLMAGDPDDVYHFHSDTKNYLEGHTSKYGLIKGFDYVKCSKLILNSIEKDIELIRILENIHRDRIKLICNFESGSSAAEYVAYKVSDYKFNQIKEDIVLLQPAKKELIDMKKTIENRTETDLPNKKFSKPYRELTWRESYDLQKYFSESDLGQMHLDFYGPHPTKSREENKT